MFDRKLELEKAQARIAELERQLQLSFDPVACSAKH
jgi:hypothetical protein